MTTQNSINNTSAFVDLAETPSPANPNANIGRLYSKDDGGTTKLYYRDSGGTETDLLSVGGSTTDAFQNWKKVTKSHSDFQIGGTSNNIEVYSFPAGYILHGVKIKPSIACSGTGITDYTVSVGLLGELTKFASAFDVYQPVADDTFQLSENFYSQHHALPTSIKANAISTGANLDQSSAGSIDFWFLVSKAV